MKRLIFVGLMTGLVSSGYANEGEVLVKSHGCMSCHRIETKAVGPALKDIARVYSNDPKSKIRLIESIKKGSKGKWGVIPMPPQHKVNDKDAETIYKWIIQLSQRSIEERMGVGSC